MENTELLAEIRAKINEVTARAIAAKEVNMDVLFLYAQLQILEKLEQIHEHLISIDGYADATANMLASETGHAFLDKKE